MYKAIRISPMIPSYNIRETVAFFKEIFSFNVFMGGEDSYTILYKDDIYIHILNAGDIGEMEFYLEVDNVDVLWESAKHKLTDTKVREPFDREYGMREMHIVIPHTKTLMFVGQSIR